MQIDLLAEIKNFKGEAISANGKSLVMGDLLILAIEGAHPDPSGILYPIGKAICRAMDEGIIKLTAKEVGLLEERMKLTVNPAAAGYAIELLEGERGEDDGKEKEGSE